MRIIIELDPSETKPVIQAEAAAGLPAMDGGSPPAALVEMLRPNLAEPAAPLAAAPEAAAPELPAIDAGPVPEWLVKGISALTEGNGQG
jgi:hypothetical protein